MTNRTIVIAAFTAVLLALPAVAFGAPRQLSADDWPKVSDPLSTNNDLRGCNKKTQKKEGKPVARFHICNGYYVFDPDDETDNENNFGAYWVQATVDAVKGWCTRSVVTELGGGGGGGVTQRSLKPGTTIRTKKTRNVTPKIRVDAQGATDSPSTIKNTFRLRPGTLKARKKGGKFRLTWTGKQKAKLAFVMGAEIRWATGDNPPTFKPQVSARFEKRSDC
jgi:hypothetical protein